MNVVTNMSVAMPASIKGNVLKIVLVASTLAIAACDVDDIVRNSFNGLGSGTGGANEPLVVFAPNQVNGFGRMLLSGDGNKLVFTDDSDTLGTNPGDDWQVWSLDLGTGALVQLTFADFTAFDFSTQIDSTDNGDQVVFVTSDDLLGTNPNTRPNVFLAATDGTNTTQVTNFTAPTDEIREAIISGDGSVIAISSDSDLTGNNVALDTHIFTMDSNGANLTQITSLRAVPTKITFSDDGSKIAFHGVGDPFGTNPNSAEIFVMNTDGSNLVQLTSSDGDSLSPQLSDDGSLVVFTSDGDLSPGLNTDGSFEVFVARTDGSGITQISGGTVDSGGGFFSIGVAHYSISGDGSYVVFTSDANFTGDNSGLDNTIFWASTDGSAVTQLLRQGTVPDSVTQRKAHIPSLDNDGSTVSFVGSVNYTSVTQPGNDKIYTIARQ